MRCGEETDWLYISKNPDWSGWELCARCVRECDAEMKDKKKDEPGDSKQGSGH